MSNKAKVQIAISFFFILGCFFLGMAIYFWYDLHQIEQGLREGSLSFVLYQIYEATGKWGVSAFYMPFCIYCFWRVTKLYPTLRSLSRDATDQ